MVGTRKRKTRKRGTVPHDPKQLHPNFNLSSCSSSDLILLDPFNYGQELSNLYPILKQALIEQTKGQFSLQYTPQTLRLVKMVEKEKQPKQEKEEKEKEIKARMQKEDC